MMLSLHFLVLSMVLNKVCLVDVRFSKLRRLAGTRRVLRDFSIPHISGHRQHEREEERERKECGFSRPSGPRTKLIHGISNCLVYGEHDRRFKGRNFPKYKMR